MTSRLFKLSMGVAALAATLGFRPDPHMAGEPECYEDTGPVALRVALEGRVALRLVGPEYQDLDDVRVVQGRRQNTAARDTRAVLGPWVDGGRDLQVIVGRAATLDSHYRIEGFRHGKRSLVLPVQMQITEAQTSPFALPPQALQMYTLDANKGPSTDRLSTPTRKSVVESKRPDRRATTVQTVDRGARRSGSVARATPSTQVPATARTRAPAAARAPAARDAIARSRQGGKKSPLHTGALPADQAKAIADARTQWASVDASRPREARYLSVEAYRATAGTRPVPTDAMLVTAQRRGLVPLGCTIHVYAGGEDVTGNVPTAFHHIVPEAPALAGSVLEIHGAYLPELAIYLDGDPLTVIEAGPSIVKAILPSEPTSGALHAARVSDGAWVTLEDEYSVVEPEAPLPYDLMDIDAEANTLRNAYLMALASLHVYPRLPEEGGVDAYRSRIADQFAAWGLELVDVFDEGGYVSGTLGSDTQGFVLTNDELLLIAFAGTQSQANRLDVVTDVNVLLVPPPLSWGQDIFVHQGFLRAADAKLDDGSTLHERVLAVAAAAQSEGKKIWITGHSLGGALAALVGYRLSHVNDIDIQGLVTFGAPRVGNPAWADAFEAEFGERGQRWVNYNDPIPAFPPILLAYEHAGVLFNLDANGEIDESREEMYYSLGPGTYSHAVVEHMCYFDLLYQLFSESPSSNDFGGWPEMEVCSQG